MPQQSQTQQAVLNLAPILRYPYRVELAVITLRDKEVVLVLSPLVSENNWHIGEPMTLWKALLAECIPLETLKLHLAESSLSPLAQLSAFLLPTEWPWWTGTRFASMDAECRHPMLVDPDARYSVPQNGRMRSCCAPWADFI